MKLENKVAIITGAGQGIGLASVQLFLMEGANVVAVDRNWEEETGLTELLAEYENRILFIQTDVSQSVEVKKMVQKTIDRFGRIDCLFNNAGMGISKKVEEMREDEWDLVLDVNLKGQFLCTHFSLPYLKKNGGSIINMSSVLGFASLPENAAYCAAKAGVISLTKTLALEVARDGIRVNAIVPGSIDTPMLWEGLTPEEMNEIAPEVNECEPIGRVGLPEEIAKAVLFLASEDSSFATGAPFIIDGGLLAKLATIR